MQQNDSLADSYQDQCGYGALELPLGRLRLGRERHAAPVAAAFWGREAHPVMAMWAARWCGIDGPESSITQRAALRISKVYLPSFWPIATGLTACVHSRLRADLQNSGRSCPTLITVT